MARDYKHEYATYQGKPDQIRKRAMRNAARRKLMNKGLVHKGDGKDVDHKKPLDKGGSNDESNLRVMSRSKNRGFRRDSRNQPI
jgi:5-methylcytosine-specific restriction endonuclease McrA